MDTENKTIQTPAPVQAKASTPGASSSATKPFVKRPFNPNYKGNSAFGSRPKNARRMGRPGEARVKPEFDQKILNIRRVTRVTAGGKRMNFSVAIVAGNRKGSVGLGTGKANDTSLAIDKAFRNARKNMMHLALTKTMSISYSVCKKYCSGVVSLMPAPGRGVIAGSAVRSIIELAGINDISAKIVSPSKNKLNIARATVSCLSMFNKGKNAVATVAKAPVEVKKVTK